MGTPSRVPEGPSDDNMQKTDRAGRKISPMVKFVLLFLVFLLIVGVVFSQLITLYITPVYYIYLDALQKTLRRIFGRPSRETEPLLAPELNGDSVVMGDRASRESL